MIDLPASQQVRWLDCLNESGEDIPPWSIMRVTGCDSERILTVDKPNADGLGVHNFVSSGPQTIISGDYGFCTRSFPVQAAYDSSSGTPALGEIWGPANASWLLKKGMHGFWVIGILETNTALVLPLPREVAVVRKTSDTLDGNGYYPGQIAHWDAVAKAWADTGTCRILDT